MPKPWSDPVKWPVYLMESCFSWVLDTSVLMPWASYQIRKIAGCACTGNAGNVFPRRRYQMKPLISDPGMHHGTCVTHVPWCMSGSLTCGDGENVPDIPGACAPAILRIWQEAHCSLDHQTSVLLIQERIIRLFQDTVYPKKYAHGFVVLCFVVVMQSFTMNSHEVFNHIHQGCFAGTGAIVRLPQCQWSKPDGHGKISQCITTTKHSKAKTVCIFLGIYCMYLRIPWLFTK